MADEPKTQTPRPIDLPAGHARNEAMRQATDELDKQAEERMAAEGSFAIDPSKLDHMKVENEIVQHLNEVTGEFDVPGAQEEYIDHIEIRDGSGHVIGHRIQYTGYAWILKDRRLIDEIRQRVRTYLGPNLPGYVRVDSSMPEHRAAKKEGMVNAEGDVEVGDCILFRCPKEIAARVNAEIQRRAASALQDPTGNLRARAERHRGPQGPYVTTRETQPQGGIQAEAVRSLAMSEVGERLRTGQPLGPLTVDRAIGRRH